MPRAMNRLLPGVFLSWLGAVAPAQTTYRLPPRPIVDCLDAPAPPAVSVSPDRSHLLLTERESMPSIAVLARPVLALAGRRIDPGSRGPQRGPRGTGMKLLTIADGTLRDLPLPTGCDVGGVVWRADGSGFAFTNTSDDRVELWVAEVKSARARRVEGVRLNATGGAPVRWTSDQKNLLCQLVVDDAAPPPAPAAPTGPTVEESRGRSAPVRTFQDLLHNEHDARLFEFYCTSRLALVDPDTARVAPLGAPALFAGCDQSPDGKWLLVTRLRRPFSYQVPATAFPSEVAVWDLTGKPVHTVADLPLQEGVPIEGVPTGPRDVRWVPVADATLCWREALDGGNPKTPAEHRDRLVLLAAPFTAAPGEQCRTTHRMQGVAFGASDGLLLVTDLDRDRRWQRTLRFTLGAPQAAAQVLFERSQQDSYNDPGRPLTRVTAAGDSVLRTAGGALLLDGPGSTPQGDRPFLDRLELASGRKERWFHCAEGVYERVVDVLTDDGSQLLIERESATEPPNWLVRDRATGAERALTRFADPTAQLTRGIRKQLLAYERDDGVRLSATLYLPPDHKPDTRLPLLVWAYPREFNDAGTAGQVRASPYRYTRLSGISHLFLLLCGYAVLDDAAMPVVGAPDKANDTFVPQIVASARAAIDKCVALGVADRDRVAIGGHSYGAFMTANLLAHSDLFRAGVARSGAYNRTLTPFGFQNERRTLWEAPEIYLKASPFLYAHQIDEPLLLIHGEADNNPGTFPIQSQRLYQAVKGNGGTVRLVMLPCESHGYRARESVLHTLAEMVDWLDQHVKHAGPRPEKKAAAPASGARRQ